MKRFNLSYLFIITFVIVFILLYIGGIGLDVYAQDLNCGQQQLEVFNPITQDQNDVNQKRMKSDEDLEKEWKEAMLTSILDDLFWLFIIAAVGATLDVITGESP